ncbi:hypothetical protein [Paenibacillus lutrae]|uniref:Uncharacterized protein n=1 Tax=Paenibacillus lutrae TaxID=2078573 RepID=A0A7X3FMP9_9BACL|nr:hypothetical protein [Paenibacillus lutrae]MVP02564.1 hypothetical protein [Paenibacillus lutrae]
MPAPGVSAGSAASAASVTAFARLTASIGMLLTISGSEAKDRKNKVYRALTSNDVASLKSGKGISAKNPEGLWSPMDHILNGSQTSALTNDPWISTTTSLTVARGYDSGNGIVAIDLSKVPSPKVHQGALYNKNSDNFDERLAYNRGVWSQEISIFQFIPQGAITGYVK